MELYLHANPIFLQIMTQKYYRLLFVFLLFCNFISAQTASDYYDAAMKSYKAKDYKSFVENLHKTLEAGANHPRIYYNLACGYALLNDQANALKWLDRIGALGIAYPISEEADLASIRGTREFKAIEEKFQRNSLPLVHSKVAFTLPETFIPEGLTYDPKSKSFFAGSTLQKKIVRVDSHWSVSDLSSARDGLYEVLGMSIDPERNFLWASSAEFLDADSDAKKVSALFRYDLKSNKLVKRYDLPSGQPHGLGDVIVNRMGDAYTTDSLNPAIYRVDHETDRLEAVPVGDLFRSPQGLCFSPDEKLLFVADYVRGIFAIDLATNQHWNLKAPSNATIAGIDGLYQYNGKLIATQNGFTPNRILRLTLNDAKDQVIRVDVLEAGTPENGEFTLGVIVGKDFYYIANSWLEKYLENHTAKLTPAMIRKLDLNAMRPQEPVN
jgi:tetratricopeptide (TPR) repeat protein